MRTAVLLMAYGGPNSLEDVEAYLLDVRGGRATPPELIEEVRERYALIGGRSPLLEITRLQARALQERLNAQREAQGPGGMEPRRFQVYVGMRHWTPYIRETLAQIIADGFEEVVALCMAPHASRLSTGAYQQKLNEAQEMLSGPEQIHFIPHWHTEPLYIQAVAEKVRAAFLQFPESAQPQLKVLFTAHSLPAAIIEQGDPYVDQLEETARILADHLGLRDGQWQLCFQSAGAVNARWLGPAVEEVLAELAEAGAADVIVTPIGFVADHVEVLYDLDIEAAQVAERLGLRLVRSESLNASPTFISALAEIVRRTLGLNPLKEILQNNEK